MTTGPDEPQAQPAPPPPPGPTSPPYGSYPPSQPPAGVPGYPPAGVPGYPPAYVQPPPSDGLGLAAMIVGIVSLVLACGYGIGLLGAPAALVMGRISMKRIDASQGRIGGRGMAQAGFVMGIIGTVLLVLAIILVVVLIVVGRNGGFDDFTFESTSSSI